MDARQQTPASEVTVSAGILTRNRKDLVLRAIESVYAQEGYPDIEVVVVDNASTDGTARAVAEHFPKVKLICLPRNLGAADGRNHVLANCTGRYIACVDDDGMLDPEVAREAVEMLESDPAIGLVALSIRYYKNREDLEAGVGPVGERVPVVKGLGSAELGTFGGGACVLRKSMLDQTGLYPEDFQIYGEEGFLAVRVIDAGYRIAGRPDLALRHPFIDPNDTDAARKRRYYYRLARNEMLIVARLFPFRLMVPHLCLRAAASAVKLLRRGLVWDYLCAVGYVGRDLIASAFCRRPASLSAAKAYLRLRY